MVFFLPAERMRPAATVLIIDDEPMIRGALRALLLRRGFLPFVASSGREGLQLAKLNPPDLILLNIQLPDQTGWQVQDELAREAATHKVPVIAITGFPSAVSRLSAVNHGFAGFLEKPFRYNDLVRTIDGVLPAHPVGDLREASD